MKHKKIRLRFIRNILICVIALLIVARILDVMPGFKRDKNTEQINIVIDDENLTENLKNEIYIDENQTIYLSLEDVKQFFDETISYKDNELITTSRTKVAVMNLSEKNININGTEVDVISTIIEKDSIIYIPIENFEIVYNIEVNYFNTTGIVAIDMLDNELTKATIAKDVNLKYKMRGFSKTLKEIKQGELVSFYDDEYLGWTKIRTNDGVVGYVKTSLLTNICKIRDNKDEIKKAEIIDENEVDGWIKINESSFENEELNTYTVRESTETAIVGLAITNETKGVYIEIDYNNENNIQILREITPRLREVGISVAVKAQTRKEIKSVEDIVDYIVK